MPGDPLQASEPCCSDEDFEGALTSIRSKTVRSRTAGDVNPVTLERVPMVGHFGA